MASYASLEKSLSFERVSNFKVTPNEPDNDTFARYIWNIEISEAFHPVLHGLEVTFRNHLFKSISNVYSQSWLNANNQNLRPEDRSEISKAQDSLTRQNKNPNDIPKLIAELKFGFWTSLLNLHYERNHYLWPKVLVTTFPNLHKTNRTRAFVSTRFNNIRKLRNRVFHYEPIWSWNNLLQIHGEILEATEWMNADSKKLFQTIDRFPIILNRGISPLPFPITRP